MKNPLVPVTASLRSNGAASACKHHVLPVFRGTLQ
jgi:hypothetical protein